MKKTKITLSTNLSVIKKIGLRWGESSAQGKDNDLPLMKVLAGKGSDIDRVRLYLICLKGDEEKGKAILVKKFRDLARKAALSHLRKAGELAERAESINDFSRRVCFLP